MWPAQHCHSQLHTGAVIKLTGGPASEEHARDGSQESKLVFCRGKMARGHGDVFFFCGDQPPPRTTGSGRPLPRGEGGGGGGGGACHTESAAASTSVPSACSSCCCRHRQRREGQGITSAETTDSSARGGRTRDCSARTSSKAGNDDANSLHSHLRPLGACFHRCDGRTDAGGDCGGDSTHGDRATVPAVVAAEDAIVVAAAADGGASICDKPGGGGGPCSQAAAEAWEAAETWATAVALATETVAIGRGSFDAVAAADGGGVSEAEAGDQTAGLSVSNIAELDNRLRQDRGATEGVALNSRHCCRRCRSSISGDFAAATGICQSTVHRRDSVLPCSSSAPAAPREVCRSTFRRRDSTLCGSSDDQPLDYTLRYGGGWGRVPAWNGTKDCSGSGSSSSSSSASTRPRNEPARMAEIDEAVSAVPPFDDPRVDKAPSWPVRTAAAGAAAAIVLARIDRGDRLWRRRARRAGLAALRAHLTRAGRWRFRNAKATRQYKSALGARGLRALGSRAKRRGARGEAAVAAAAAATAAAFAADVFVRKQSLRRLVATLERNLQARTALRSRDDLADLHFAEWRVPCAVRAWQGQTQDRRSSRHSDVLAKSKWRLSYLKLALAKWVRHSLGGEDKRRRLRAWRDALSNQNPTHPPYPPPPPPPPPPPCLPRKSLEFETLRCSDDGERGEANELRLSQQRAEAGRKSAGQAPAICVRPPPAPTPLHRSSGPASLAAAVADEVAQAASEYVSGRGGRSSSAAGDRPQDGKPQDAMVVTHFMASPEVPRGGVENKTRPDADRSHRAQGKDQELEDSFTLGRAELVRSASGMPVIGLGCLEEQATDLYISKPSTCHPRVWNDGEGQKRLPVEMAECFGDRGPRAGRLGENQYPSTTEVGPGSILSNADGENTCAAGDDGKETVARRPEVANGDETRKLDESVQTAVTWTNFTATPSAATVRKATSPGSGRLRDPRGGGGACDGQEGEEVLEQPASKGQVRSPSSLAIVERTKGDKPGMSTVADTKSTRVHDDVITTGEDCAPSFLVREEMASPGVRAALTTNTEATNDEARPETGRAGHSVTKRDDNDGEIASPSAQTPPRAAAPVAVNQSTRSAAVDGQGSAAAFDIGGHEVHSPSRLEADRSASGGARTLFTTSQSSSPMSAPRYTASGSNATAEPQQQRRRRQQQEQLPLRVAAELLSKAPDRGSNSDAPAGTREVSKTAGVSSAAEKHRQDITRGGSTIRAGVGLGVDDGVRGEKSPPPLSSISASRVEERRFREGRNFTRTLSGGYCLLPVREGARDRSCMQGPGEDGEATDLSSTPQVTRRKGRRDSHRAKAREKPPALRVACSPPFAEEGVPSCISNEGAGSIPQPVDDLGAACPRPMEEDVQSCASKAGGTSRGMKMAQCAALQEDGSDDEANPALEEPTPPPSQMISPEDAGERNDFACAGFSNASGCGFEHGSSVKRRPTISQQASIGRVSSSGAPESTGKLVRSFEVRPASPTPLERQAPPEHRRQTVSPRTSSDNVGVGSSSPAFVRGVPEESTPAAEPTPVDTVTGATDPQQPQNSQHLEDASSAASLARDAPGGTFDAMAGVVLTFPASGQAASSEFSCISWSARDGTGRGGGGGGGSNSSSNSSSNSCSASASASASGGNGDGGSGRSCENGRSSSRPGEESAAVRDVKGDADSSRCCSSVNLAGSRRSGSGVYTHTPEGTCLAGASSSGPLHITPSNKRTYFLTRVDAPAVDGSWMPHGGRSGASSGTSSAPAAAGSEGGRQRKAERPGDMRLDRRGSGFVGGDRGSGIGGGSRSASCVGKLVRSGIGGGGKGSGGGRESTRGGSDVENRSERSPDPYLQASVFPACISSLSSGSRRRGTLEERVSDASLRRRLLETGLRKWQRQAAGSACRRLLARSLTADAATFTKWSALVRWRAAHAHLLSRQAAAAARRSRLFRRVAPRLDGGGAPPMAVAAVTVRRWHRRSASKASLRRAFEAWGARALSCLEARRHLRCILARRGLLSWRRWVREAGAVRCRSATVDSFMSRAAAGRRLRAWLHRRRRRIDALRVAEDHRAAAVAGAGTTTAATPWRRQQRRQERLRMEAVWRWWRTAARERAAAQSARYAVIAGVESRLRKRAIEEWRARAGERRRWRRLLAESAASRARCMGKEGLRSLNDGALDARAHREALRIGDEHCRRQRGILLIAQLRILLESRRHFFRRVGALRLRAAALTGLRRWRRGLQDTGVSRDALIKGEIWRRRRATEAGVAALSHRSRRRVAQGRAMRAGRLHFARTLANSAVAAWRVWIWRRAAAVELYDAATALHRSWTASAGMRALDRVARARTSRREAAHAAEQYFLRAHGLGRWRAAAASRAHARAQAEVATVHWAATLSSKVLFAWAAAAIQQWAEARQAEAAAEHRRLALQRRALRLWAAVVLSVRPVCPTAPTTRSYRGSASTASTAPPLYPRGQLSRRRCL